MSSDNADARHIFGHIHVVGTTISRQLLGLVLAFIALCIIGWAVDSSTPITPRVLYTAIAGFILYNGLYVGGVRLRDSGS